MTLIAVHFWHCLSVADPSVISICSFSFTSYILKSNSDGIAPFLFLLHAAHLVWKTEGLVPSTCKPLGKSLNERKRIFLTLNTCLSWASSSTDWLYRFPFFTDQFHCHYFWLVITEANTVPWSTPLMNLVIVVLWTATFTTTFGEQCLLWAGILLRCLLSSISCFKQVHTALLPWGDKIQYILFKC